MTGHDAPAGESLQTLLRRVLGALRQTWSAELARFELAPHQGRALRVVAEAGPLRLSELAEQLRIAPRSVTEVADSLQACGLIARSPDPSDRRATLLAVTDEGAAIAAEVIRVREAEAEEFFGQLSAADRATLARILTTLLPD